MTTTENPIAPQSVALLLEGRDAVRTGRGARLRQAARLSQSDVARSLDVSPSCVSRWEAGTRQPAGATAIKYAQLLRTIAQEIAGTTRTGRG